MYFRGEYDFLSNMFYSPITVKLKGSNGTIPVTFKCVESAFQAMKCTSLQGVLEFTNLNGFEAKKKGRRVALRDKWDERKISIMKDLLLLKFSDPELKQKLLSIHEPIVEDNTWGDKFWGRCRGVGKNTLGKLLMEVQKELS